VDDLSKRLRDVDRNPPNLHERQRIADELDHLRRELAERNCLLNDASRWMRGHVEKHSADILSAIDAAIAPQQPDEAPGPG
jgi:hypothetical protein